MRRWMLALAALVAVSSTVVACGGGDDKKTIDTGDGGKVTVGGDLPDDFPDSFPVYDGADFQGGVESSQGGVDGFAANWTTGDSVKDVSDFYEKEFEDGDWKSTGSGNAGGGSFWLVENADEGLTAYVLIAEADGDTAITAIVGDSDDTGTGGDEPTEPADQEDPTPDDSSSGGDTGSSDLPDEVDLDDDFPVALVYFPSDGRITGSSSFSSDQGDSYFVEIYVKSDDPESIADKFKDEMKSKAWENAFSSEADGTYVQTYSKGDGAETASLSVSKSDVNGYVLVNMTVITTKSE